MRQLEFFYDIVSPYSYLAFVVLERYRVTWNLDLVLRPAFLGGVMAATGNAPPASLPARAPYLLRDVARNSRYFDVTMTMPDEFPGKTLNAMRLLIVVKDAAPEKLSALSRALWERHWGQGKDVNDPARLADVCTTAGVDANLLARISEQATKDALKAATDEAVERGAFGFPAMFTDVDGDDTLFFGSDRLGQMAHELALPWRGPRGPS
jgi:glutathione S-transferase kappa 1